MGSYFLYWQKVWKSKGRVSIGTCPLQNGSFCTNTASKCHGRRQPYHGTFPRLVTKTSRFEVQGSFGRKIFDHGSARGRRNTVCISRTMVLLWGKRFVQNRTGPYGGSPRGEISISLSPFKPLSLKRPTRWSPDPLIGNPPSKRNCFLLLKKRK